MKNKIVKRLLCAALVAATAFSAIGCKKKTSEVIDKTKTQIYVRSYTKGYGRNWLDAWKRDFEAKYAETEFEPGSGKKGAQVVVQADSFDDLTQAQMNVSGIDIYFMQNQSYYTTVADTSGDGLEDLTSLVKGVSSVDGKTIESKLNAQQKEFFGIKGDDGNAHYYGLPHYYGTSGIIYNVDLFEDRGFYFAEDGEFISDDNSVRSAGPDGIPGNEDDGLPRTYAEFFKLLDEMCAQKIIPFVWSGANYTYYLGQLLDSLVADYEGVDDMKLNYTFSGTEKLVKFNADGTVAKDADGNLILEETEVKRTNGYDVARQPGKYYAMEFLNKLMTTDKYHTDDAYKQTSQTMAEQAFLENGWTVTGKKKIAMLVDGPWWENEASEIMKSMALMDKKWAKENRNFGWMPLPAATQEKYERRVAGEKSVFYDSLNTMVIMTKNSGSRKEACFKFLEYISSDEALKTFAKETGALRGYSLELTDAEIKEMNLSSFSASLLRKVNASDTLYRYTSDSFFNNNQAIFKYDVAYACEGYSNVPQGFREGKMSAEAYFTAYYDFLKNKHGSLWQK